MTLSGGPGDPELMEFARAAAAGDQKTALRPLAASPELARVGLEQGATRQAATTWFLDDISHQVYRGDTALHVVAAAHQSELARQLIGAGADVRARNRRGAEPLHYAVDGNPASSRITVTVHKIRKQA